MEQSRESDADDVVDAFGFTTLLLGIASAAFALMHLIDQPYTDEELSNFIDTWQPEVWGGLVVLALLALGTLGSMLFAFLCKSLPRKLFGAAAVAFAVGFALEVASLNLLTARAEKASGQALSWWPLANNRLQPTLGNPHAAEAGR